VVKPTLQSDGIWTVPNAISALRVLGIPLLLWTAHSNQRMAFLWVAVALLLSDWLDGKLATVLDQKTTLGARLDSSVDALMYGSMALSFWWLENELAREKMTWFLVVVASWALSAVVALLRFRKLPSYHMWSAKLAWFVAAWTIVLLLLKEVTFLLPWALALVVFSNLHAVAITLVLPRWAADVWSLRQAWAMRKAKE